jgi:hypothetical protein
MSSFKSPVFLRRTSASFLRQNISRSAAGIFLSCAALLAISGCAVFSPKVDLKKIPVASIQATQAKGPGIAPGEKSPLIVTVTQPDGKTLTTKDKVRWKDLQVSSTMGSISSKGVLALSSDPRVSEGKPPHVVIDVPSHPDVKSAELDIPLRYDRKYSASFFGASGSSGFDGTDGIDGSSGTMGSIDPDHPSAGGDGGNGGNGTNGSDGFAGEDGPAVRVLVALRYGPNAPIAGPAGAPSGPLLQVSVSSGRTEQLFLLDPNGGLLTVTSAGGLGGIGGRGGRGGRGGSGGIGTPNGHDGSNGTDGSSGMSGRDGSGGPIFVTYDPRARPYLNAIQLRNPGGPAPIVREGAVGPLW